MLSGLRSAADRLIELAALAGSVALWCLVGVVLVDVTGRAFGSPLFGAQDIATMAFVIVVFGGMALCDREGGHIAVDLLERHMPPRVNHLIDIAIDLLGGVIFLTIAWSVFQAAKLSRMLNLSTNLLNLPQAWFQWAIAALSVITALAMLLRAVQFITSGRSSHRHKDIA